ncbi:hypothetical protein CORC01_02508 [Colletotrichum orchidophilum]|uniref:Uncharacterized protein n=1 Tax=Colletotrichum orchidophilum TaxID=1209926 RepID=A0A1G4BLP5_9PEZI|nr:uncharacterized protein CORC01_02508 [Colletotrichum orchidophilum]OHF02228.1 hypothetical protein CORC01_02508 [Colletotrichum orchidophilum]
MDYHNPDAFTPFSASDVQASVAMEELGFQRHAKILRTLFSANSSAAYDEDFLLSFKISQQPRRITSPLLADQHDRLPLIRQIISQMSPAPDSSYQPGLHSFVWAWLLVMPLQSLHLIKDMANKSLSPEHFTLRFHRATIAMGSILDQFVLSKSPTTYPVALSDEQNASHLHFCAISNKQYPVYVHILPVAPQPDDFPSPYVKSGQQERAIRSNNMLDLIPLTPELCKMWRKGYWGLEPHLGNVYKGMQSVRIMFRWLGASSARIPTTDLMELDDYLVTVNHNNHPPDGPMPPTDVLSRALLCDGDVFYIVTRNFEESRNVYKCLQIQWDLVKIIHLSGTEPSLVSRFNSVRVGEDMDAHSTTVQQPTP